jgi:hypothetical protein
MGSAFGIESSGIVGSGLHAEGELVQLCAFPNSGGRTQTGAVAGAARIDRPSARRRRLR